MWAYVLILFFGVLSIVSGEFIISPNEDAETPKLYPVLFDKNALNYVLYYLVKNNSNIDHCKTVVKNHCVILNQLFPNVSFCINQEEACQRIINNSNFVNTLNDDLKNQLKKQSVSQNESMLLQEKCHLLEQTFPELIGLCDNFRISYYRKKREEAADEVLLRLLQTDFSDDAECLLKLSESCPGLMTEMPEVVLKCLEPKETCAHLKKIFYHKCKDVSTTIQFQLKVNSLTPKALLTLELCHFYKGICSSLHSEIRKQCKTLKERYNSMDLYLSLPSPYHTPIEKKPLLGSVAAIDSIFYQYRKDGLYMDSPTFFPTVQLYMAFLIQATNSTSDQKSLCKEILKNHCGFLSKLSAEFENICKASHVICDSFESTLSASCQRVAKWLVSKGITNDTVSNGKDGSRNLSWFELPVLTLEACSEFQVQCSYLGSYCPGLERLCYNLELACYKTSRNFFTRKLLERFLSGTATTINKFNCTELFIENVRENKGSYMVEMLDFLFDHKNSCSSYQETARKKCLKLGSDLLSSIDNSNIEECDELERRCDNIIFDCLPYRARCFAYKGICDWSKTAIKLIYDLIPLKTDVFYSMNSCLVQLHKQCPLLMSWGKYEYENHCKRKRKTCNMLLYHSKKICDIFLRNLEEYKIVEMANIKPTSWHCNYWEKFCHLLVPSCFSKLYSICHRLVSACEAYHINDRLVHSLAQEIKGNLIDKSKCLLSLDNYCENPKNTTLGSLCSNDVKDAAKKASGREKICEKVLEHVEVQCFVAQRELEEASIQLTKALSLMEKSAAIDAFAMGFNVNNAVEIQCNNSYNKCMFQNECQQIREPCEVIQTLCTKVNKLLTSSLNGITCSKVTGPPTTTRCSAETKRITETVTVTDTIEIDHDASLYLKSLHRWVLCYIAISVIIFTAVVS